MITTERKKGTSGSEEEGKKDMGESEGRGSVNRERVRRVLKIRNS